MVQEKPHISVVIPTLGREELLCQCLEDVLRQDHPSFETIVVDQTPRHQPETVAFLNRIQDRIRHVRQEQPSVTAACNKGAQVASGNILVFLDDDDRISDTGFLRHHEACYQDPTVGCVAGRVRDPEGKIGRGYHPQSADPVWGWYYTEWDHEVRAEVVTAPGANMSCRKDLFERVGGFDERFAGNAVRYENDFCLRIRHIGFRIIFEPAAWVFHVYNSPGGHNNRHLYGTSEDSHQWYQSYFRNMVYVTLTHMPRSTWPLVLWKLWRSHVFNGPYVRMGIRFVGRRHRAFGTGLWQGLNLCWNRPLRPGAVPTQRPR